MSNLLFLVFINLVNSFNTMHHNDDTSQLLVKKCRDFDITGKGDNPCWKSSPWTEMSIMDETSEQYETKFKMLYSDNGIYILGYCEDKLITTDYTVDQGDIWNGDVFEAFLQTDESNPLYFEYEINPLNTELVILVPNNNGDFFGWLPWHYEGERKVKKAVYIHDGVAKSGTKVSGWTVELFFPYALFKALKNVPPKPGTKWKGNFYRMDYDTGDRIKWGWKSIDEGFHEYEKFGNIIFE